MVLCTDSAHLVANESQMAPKSTQHEPKWLPNGPQMVPKLTLGVLLGSIAALRGLFWSSLGLFLPLRELSAGGPLDPKLLPKRVSCA